MIAYFDTSGLVKLLIDEPGSDTAEASWHAADVRVCCTVGFTEAASAIGRAWRTGRIDDPTTHALLEDLTEMWAGVTRIPADDLLAGFAAELAVLYGLRGYDAIHLAAAIEPGAILVTADSALLAAAREAGLDTIDVNG